MDIEQPSLYCACFVESCQTSPIKREKRNFGIVTRLFVSYLFGGVHNSWNEDSEDTITSKEGCNRERGLSAII
jgi:hypothetical protein